MPDLTAIELQARDLSPSVPTRLVDHVLNAFSRALFALAVAFGGMVVATVVLLAGVVGAPVVAAVLAALAFRRRRAPVAGALAPTG